MKLETMEAVALLRKWNSEKTRLGILHSSRDQRCRMSFIGTLEEMNEESLFFRSIPGANGASVAYTTKMLNEMGYSELPASRFEGFSHLAAEELKGRSITWFHGSFTDGTVFACVELE
jgi:hypothetical protein